MSEPPPDLRSGPTAESRAPDRGGRRSDGQADLTRAVTLLVGATVLGWLLHVGAGFLVPLMVAWLLAYLLLATCRAMDRSRWTRLLPMWSRYVLVLGLSVVAVAAGGWALVRSVYALAAEIPRYAETFRPIVAPLADALDVSAPQDWGTALRTAASDFGLRSLATSLEGVVVAFAGATLLVLLYASFMLTERGGFVCRLHVALPGPREARARALIRRIDERAGSYLVVKMGTNVLEGAVSFAALWLLGIDFALLFGVLTGVLNFIPYAGSVVGVVLPSLVAFAQSGSVSLGLWTLGLLVVLQLLLGSVVEPQIIGESFDLPALVVLAALAFWTALWGLAGAVLAVPMTSILVVILAEFETTRPIAILLTSDGEVDPTRADGTDGVA